MLLAVQCVHSCVVVWPVAVVVAVVARPAAPNLSFLSVLPTQVPSLGTFTIDGSVQRKAGGVPSGRVERKGRPIFVPASELLQRCGGKRGGGGGAGPRKPGDRIAVHPVSFVDVARHVGKVRQWDQQTTTKGGQVTVRQL